MTHSLAPAQASPGPSAVLGWPRPSGGGGLDASFLLAPFRFVLVLRAALVNALALGLAAVAWLHGLVGPIFATDTTYISHLIVAVFLVGLATCLRRIVQVSGELNEVKERRPSAGSRAGQFLAQARVADSQGRASLAGALRLKLSSRIAGVRQFANNLVLLGLIGTVVGFIIALSGVDPGTVGDASAIAPMVSSLIEGMGVALYTTLVGSVLNIWLMLNCRLLEGGAVHLLAHLIEEGERHARA
jgi:MotA/TolQ/ExbB proton channel family